jgi:guanylate kinase
MRQGEVPGREYIFITRDKMESDIAAGKFIEHGEFRGHLYGTSEDSVKSIINAGSVCIMNPHYQAIKTLRTAQLKPYMIHIKPPSFEVLQETRSKSNAISTHDENKSRGFSVSSFFTLFSFYIFHRNIRILG